MKRTAGILCPLFSLPGEFGIGQMGKSAFEFIDFLSESGYAYWQILPFHPIGAGNSPYSSPSAFAGYFAFIDPMMLENWGLATSLQLPFIQSHIRNKVDYGFTEKEMRNFLKTVFQSFFHKANRDMLASYDLFQSQQHYWLHDYALFASIKSHFDGKPWYDWPEPFKTFHQLQYDSYQNLLEEIEFEKFVQFLFFKQWKELKNYAESKNIQIIGDMPIYVSYDSAEVWSHPELFELNEDLSLKNVAGVPPDYFSENGQLWGFPIYKWSEHQNTNFHWWKTRLDHLLALVHEVRFDHFRGIEAFWSVPAEEKTAKNGKWIKAPGKELLEAIYSDKDSGLIAENLGNISNEVEELRKNFHIPGMKIFQFAFGNIHSEHLPHQGDIQDIYYSGTHDNDLLNNWLKDLSKEQIKHLLSYFGASFEQLTSSWIIDRILASPAQICIFPIQDILNKGTESRTNIPGTVSDDNWSWRMNKEELLRIDTIEIQEKLKLFGRFFK